MSPLLLNTNVFMLTVSLSWLFALRCMVSAQVRTGRLCRWNQLTILRPAGVECLNCPNCPEGHGLVPQCGSRITADVIVECVSCEEGKGYSNRHDFSSCKPCTICDPNEETISPCTATKNAVCGNCNAGYYRAVTGDCHPCSWCCADSKDDDKEQQCIEQTGLPASQVCRYDVNTIKCAPRTNSTALAPTTSAFTKPAGSEGAVAYGKGREEVKVDKGILLFAIGTLAVALVLCALLGVLYIYLQKNRLVSKMWWKMLCVTHSTQVVSADSPASPIVFGRKTSEGQMV